MAINGSVKLTWGDAEHEFNVAKIKQVLELEEKCGAGVAEIFDRLRNNRWRINDLRETLRLGLIGGGMEPSKALKLVISYCDERPWRESLQPALVVIMAAMVGVPGDEVGKKTVTEGTKNEGAGQSSAPMAASSAPLSTASVPLPDSPRVN